MDKIEHIGIAVKSLRDASPLYERLLGYKSYKTEEVASENVITEFFKVGDSKIELLEASSDESAIHGFIQ
uniref:VOC family protein n=1 Tax=Daejeonella sp. TaxID=2805397 RepID=UPI004049B148